VTAPDPKTTDSQRDYDQQQVAYREAFAHRVREDYVDFESYLTNNFSFDKQGLEDAVACTPEEDYVQTVANYDDP